MPRPDLLIYLKASVPTLISQIRRRGRAYEMNIDEQYLRRLNDRYDDWIENIYRGEVLVIDKDREDFVADAAVMEKICARLDRKREELETAKNSPYVAGIFHAAGYGRTGTGGGACAV